MSDSRSEPQWCDAWTSHDDVGGEGERTFYHECGQQQSHGGKHTCMGHVNEWDGAWDSCNEEWQGVKQRR